MKRDKELQKYLSKYSVSLPPTSEVDLVKERVMSVSIPKGIPLFNPRSFLFSLIRTLPKSFYLLCVMFIGLVSAVYYLSDNYSSAIIMSIGAPFLGIGTIPGLISNFNPERMELEASCLNPPKTVLAGKMVICGVIDIATVIACSVICSDFDALVLMVNLTLGLIGFTASAFISLLMCVFFKAQTGVFISLGVFVSLSLAMLGDYGLGALINSSSIWLLLSVLITLAVLMIPVCMALFKKYTFEGSAKLGNHN